MQAECFYSRLAQNSLNRLVFLPLAAEGWLANSGFHNPEIVVQFAGAAIP